MLSAQDRASAIRDYYLRWRAGVGGVRPADADDEHLFHTRRGGVVVAGFGNERVQREELLPGATDWCDLPIDDVARVAVRVHKR